MVIAGCKDEQNRFGESKAERGEARTGAATVGRNETASAPKATNGKETSLSADVRNDSQRAPTETRPSQANDTTGKRISAEGTFRPAPGNKAHGDAELKEVAGGVRIEIDVEDAPAGRKAIDLYRASDCSDILGREPSQRHAADLGYIMIDEDGDGEATIVVPAVHLEGEDARSLARQAIVIHEANVSGESSSASQGPPIACAVIQPS